MHAEEEVSYLSVCLFQDIINSMSNSPATSKPPVTLRLVVPASQCGSLIGKGGSKIKEMREVWEETAVTIATRQDIQTINNKTAPSGTN